MRPHWLAIIVLTACGRVGFDATVGEGEDGGLEEAPENFFDLGSFGPAALLPTASVSDANECHPTLTSDHLELYFTSTRTGQNELYVSARSTQNEPFGEPQRLSELSSDGESTTPAVSPDGLTLWFASDRGGGAGGLDIYVARRASRTSAWSAPTNVSELNSPSDEHSPGPRADGLAISVTRRVDGRGRDLLTATRGALEDAWSAPVADDELNTDAEDADAFLDASGRFILFDSNRLGNGFRDVFVSTRDGDTWGPAVELSELNSDRSDADPWLSADYRVIVFSSSRAGSDDLYIARR